ncbi:MAG: hypothetical protein K1000chlam2_00862 [Chlamydiae bacterium]|nr:hypothetical protein [Chlamydiota bacterium]
MVKNWKSKIAQYVESGKLPQKIASVLESFYESYLETVGSEKSIEPVFVDFLERVAEQCPDPYIFEPYHERIRAPFDYYAFGIRFLRPLVDKSVSSILGEERLEEITGYLKQDHNVVFLANHQTEGDPLAICVLLEEHHPTLGEEMIFVAGERVTTDPLAIPFSMGRNLLCIYSKRYIDHPPEQKHQKQLHNKKTMQLMSGLLKKGGKCIYVAPSGGRDRRNEEGVVEIAPFDPQSIEMFYLMAKKSKTPTHFYPMALGTYKLLPPPETIQVELGEKRSIKRAGIHLAIGPEIDMEHFPGSDNSDKHVRRKSRADYIWELVHQDYERFPKGM